MFAVSKKVVPLHPKTIGLWCNGNTADSGPAFPGSSPGSPTEKRILHQEESSSFFTQKQGIHSLHTCAYRVTFNENGTIALIFPLFYWSI